MKILLREIEDDGYVPSRTRLLTFKEFCHYVYEPTMRIRSKKFLEAVNQNPTEPAQKSLITKNSILV